MALTGGCLCRAVRYEVRGEPVRMLNCYCRDCQQASGGAFAAILVVPKAETELTGELRYFGVTAASGKQIERGFCPTCGSQVAVKLERAPEMLGLQAGSLDDPAAHRPTLECYTESAPPWAVMAEGTKKFPREITRAG